MIRRHLVSSANALQLATPPKLPGPQRFAFVAYHLNPLSDTLASETAFRQPGPVKRLRPRRLISFVPSSTRSPRSQVNGCRSDLFRFAETAQRMLGLAPSECVRRFASPTTSRGPVPSHEAGLMAFTRTLCSAKSSASARSASTPAFDAQGECALHGGSRYDGSRVLSMRGASNQVVGGTRAPQETARRLVVIIS